MRYIIANVKGVRDAMGRVKRPNHKLIARMLNAAGNGSDLREARPELFKAARRVGPEARLDAMQDVLAVFLEHETCDQRALYELDAEADWLTCVMGFESLESVEGTVPVLVTSRCQGLGLVFLYLDDNGRQVPHLLLVAMPGRHDALESVISELEDEEGITARELECAHFALGEPWSPPEGAIPAADEGDVIEVPPEQQLHGAGSAPSAAVALRIPTEPPVRRALATGLQAPSLRPGDRSHLGLVAPSAVPAHAAGLTAPAAPPVTAAVLSAPPAISAPLPNASAADAPQPPTAGRAGQRVQSFQRRYAQRGGQSKDPARRRAEADSASAAEVDRYLEESKRAPSGVNLGSLLQPLVQAALESVEGDD